jgi:hypothetical protein
LNLDHEAHVPELRHSFASTGAVPSMGVRVIEKLLGRSQAATTHRYADLDVDPLRRAANTTGATIAAKWTRKKPASGCVAKEQNAIALHASLCCSATHRVPIAILRRPQPSNGRRLRRQAPAGVGRRGLQPSRSTKFQRKMPI